jgi:hypothetical protein
MKKLFPFAFLVLLNILLLSTSCSLYRRPNNSSGLESQKMIASQELRPIKNQYKYFANSNNSMYQNIAFLDTCAQHYPSMKNPKCVLIAMKNPIIHQIKAKERFTHQEIYQNSYHLPHIYRLSHTNTLSTEKSNIFLLLALICLIVAVILYIIIYFGNFGITLSGFFFISIGIMGVLTGIFLLIWLVTLFV